MKTSETVDQLYPAIIAAQSQLTTINRDKTVRTGKFDFKYAPLDTVMESIKTILQANGLAVMQAVNQDNLTTRVIHTSGQWAESQTMLNREQASMQMFGAEVSYKRRYSLSAMLGIVSDDDVDGPETKQKKDAPVITPRGGIGENLPEDWKIYLRDLAGEITDLVNQGKLPLAKEAADRDNLDSDQRTYLENQLTSQVRTALKKPIVR